MGIGNKQSRRDWIVQLISDVIVGLMVAGIVALFGGPAWACFGFGLVVYFVLGILPRQSAAQDRSLRDTWPRRH